MSRRAALRVKTSSESGIVPYGACPKIAEQRSCDSDALSLGERVGVRAGDTSHTPRRAHLITRIILARSCAETKNRNCTALTPTLSPGEREFMSRQGRSAGAAPCHQFRPTSFAMVSSTASRCSSTSSFEKRITRIPLASISRVRRSSFAPLETWDKPSSSMARLAA